MAEQTESFKDILVAGLWSSNPVFGLLLAVALPGWALATVTFLVGSAALAGLPPFAGFFSKDAILFQVELGQRLEWRVDRPCARRGKQCNHEVGRVSVMERDHLAATAFCNHGLSS